MLSIVFGQYADIHGSDITINALTIITKRMQKIWNVRQFYLIHFLKQIIYTINLNYSYAIAMIDDNVTILEMWQCL